MIIDLLIVGCGPAGATAAREAARAGIETVVLERDAIVGQKRGQRRALSARVVFLAPGATARLDEASFGRIAMQRWRDGLMTTLQHRVYLGRPAASLTRPTAKEFLKPQ
jgi:2-polyprenyl-6-methoxyphenol hydroxylase-like FAD-dependent oxidoreductase